MEKDEFFSGFVPEEPEVAPETPEAQPEAQPEAVQPEQPEAPAVPPPAPEADRPAPEPGHVPLTALLDERERRKELERRLAALEEARTEAAAPDPNADPAGWHQFQFQQVQNEMLHMRLNMSEIASRRHYGDEATDQAKQWALSRFAENPAFQAEVLQQADPYGYAIEAYHRDQIASQVTPDQFKAFQAWQQAQAQIPPAQAEPIPPPAAVPKSIASLPSAGGNLTDAPMSSEDAFAAAIK